MTRVINPLPENIGFVRQNGAAYVRDTASDITVGRSFGANDRGFFQFSTAGLKPHANRIELRFELVQKTGSPLDTQNLKVVWPPTANSGDDIAKTPDDELWNSIDSAEIVLGELSIATPVGVTKLALNELGVSLLNELVEFGGEFNAGLRIQGSPVGVKWTLSRSFGIKMAIGIPGGSQRRLMGVGR